MTYARIVPPKREGDGPQMTQGTEVWVGEQRLTGVLKVEILADPGDFWRAVIHCAVVPQDMAVDYEIRYASLWHYLKAWWGSR